MTLSEDQKAQVQAWIEQKWNDVRCWACRPDEDTWAISDVLMEIRGYEGGYLVAGPSPLIPVVVVGCTRCGNSALLNAIEVGIVSAESSQDA